MVIREWGSLLVHTERTSTHLGQEQQIQQQRSIQDPSNLQTWANTLGAVQELLLRVLTFETPCPHCDTAMILAQSQFPLYTANIYPELLQPLKSSNLARKATVVVGNHLPPICLSVAASAMSTLSLYFHVRKDLLKQSLVEIMTCLVLELVSLGTNVVALWKSDFQGTICCLLVTLTLMTPP